MKNMNTMTLLAAGTCAMIAASGAQAGMVYWNMVTASPTSNNIGNLTVSDLTQGNNNGTTTMITTTSPSSVYTFDLNGTSTTASGSSNAGAATRTGALATGGASGSAYFQFTLTAGTGYSGSLTAIGFGTRSTSTGPVSFTLRSSADSYASDLATATGSANSAWSYKTASLVTAASLAEGATVTFRLYGYGGAGSATANTANWRIDDMTVTATTTAVPAPGALALLGVAGLIGSRRRR